MVKDDRFAQPGDEDLDLDIDGVTITAIIVDDREILIGTKGGYGEWIGTDGKRSVFRPGEPDEYVEYAEFHLLYPEASDKFFAALLGRFTEWYDQSTPLRLCGAPGRMFALIENKDKWLPLPRNWPDD